MGQIKSLDEFLSLLWRRRLLIVAIVLFGSTVSLILGLSQSKVYEAGAVIQVESPVVSDDGNAQPGIQSARILQVIEQRLTTRENLTEIIERHGLFADLPTMSTAQKIAALRSAVTFQSVASTAQQNYGVPSSVSALIIVTRFADGDQAARVANDFAQSVLDLSTARQTARAQETLNFFLAEEGRVTSEIATVESQLAVFKNENSAALPASRDRQRSEISSLEGEMQRLDQTLVALRGEKAALEKKPRLGETDRRQLEDLAAQITALQAQRSKLTAQQTAISSVIARTLEIERALANFDRRLTQLQSQYDAVTARKAEAETNLRLDEQQHSEHFTLLERAIVPEYPTGGSGDKIAIMGAIASVVAALALAFVLDLLNPVLRSSAQMERQVGLRPVITIPELSLRPATPTWSSRVTAWFRSKPQGTA